jgi:multidrug efflux pump subunit AcrB
MKKLLRRAHLYLGVFFTPLLLLYVVTGWLMTVNPDRRKGAADSDDVASRLARVHVEQYWPSPRAEAYATGLYRGLAVVMSAALIVTVVLGVVLAFQTLRPPWAVWLALLLGVAAPVAALWLGQRSSGP